MNCSLSLSSASVTQPKVKMTVYLISALLPTLLPLSLATTFYPGAGNSFRISNQNATYDYVIVGGGTAGLAVAMRLAEDPSYTIAVIEAGGFYQIENGNQSVVPAYNPEFAALNDPTANPTVDWGFVTTPQAGANNRSLHYARGKTLGGSSALNANIYNRGTRGSYHQWAEIVGDDSYEFDNWLPFFAKGTNYTTPNTTLRAANTTVPVPINGSSQYNGGPVRISHSNFALPFTSWVQLAFESFSFRNLTSFSNGELLGAQYVPAVLQPDSNQRETSETSYLETAFASGRTNLKIYTHSLALQVMFSLNKTAKAVKVRTGVTEYFLTARKEIISSAGAFQSPQLLMVSGIGPAPTLAAHSISLIADRPGVGKNMWDHIDMEVTWKVGVVGFNTLSNTIFAAEQAQLFQNEPAASIYGSYGADFIGWEKLPEPYRSNLSSTSIAELAFFGDDWPEIEYEIASVYESGIEGDFDGYGTFVIVPVSPTSRGNVTLQSSSMLDPPIINPNWLTSQTDQELALNALKRGREIISSAAMQPILIGNETAPGQEVQSDEELMQMGTERDEMAVVDGKGRVIGVRGLRVVDASAFAVLPPGHPHANPEKVQTLAVIPSSSTVGLSARTSFVANTETLLTTSTSSTPTSSSESGGGGTTACVPAAHTAALTPLHA
ncbi:related to choline dehydrogenase [Phialocephala subalpina]|uniref:Related to choline dehydrogenase n=1 Tax=Phialocephala subalpina TaxID=576137 RepID=A0A1L7WJ50_9HELO|nr:related to choline dehydrogenase [Phialocephala subalpina]